MLLRCTRLRLRGVRLLSAPAPSAFSIAGEGIPGRSAYLDGAATTPIDPRVLDAMLPWMTSLFGNAPSRTHMYGWESEAAVEKAREQVDLTNVCRRRHSLRR